MKRTTLVLSALAGAALFEAALIPGVLIGGAAVLAPKVLPRYFARLRRPRPTSKPAASASPAAAKFEWKRAVFKTITFRAIATSLDFTSNYVIIGDIAASAALSAYGFVAGPLFFFAHEALWSRFGPAAGVVNAPIPFKAPLDSAGKFTINRALAKTITFRAIVTTTDFTANFVVTRDLTEAAILTAFGFVVGPFIYYYHEKAWDRINPPAKAPHAPIPPAVPGRKARVRTLPARPRKLPAPA